MSELPPGPIVSNYPRSVASFTLSREHAEGLIALYYFYERLVNRSVLWVVLAALTGAWLSSIYVAVIVIAIAGYFMYQESRKAFDSVMRLTALGNWKHSRTILSIIPFFAGPLGLIMLMPCIVLQRKIIKDLKLYSTTLNWETASELRKLGEVDRWVGNGHS